MVMNRESPSQSDSENKCHKKKMSYILYLPKIKLCTEQEKLWSLEFGGMLALFLG